MGESIDDQLTYSKKENGRYINPWKEWRQPSIFKYIFKVHLWEYDRSGVGNDEDLKRNLPVMSPDLEALSIPPQDSMQLMWVGHATVLAQFDGLTIITDPQFSARSSPIQWLMGAKRYRPPPCREADLPTLDAVLISHTHYDHLDATTCINLYTKFGTALTWFVPMGLKTWMESTLQMSSEEQRDRVVELDWWQEHTIQGRNIKVVFTPAQHWCKRTATDDNQVLWGSWTVMGPTRRFFFAGDTGYSEECFTQIGRKFGPFDLAAIPIGAYYPRWFMEPQHVDPVQAVQLHKDIKAKTSVGIHWGTFKMTYEPYMEPVSLLSKSVKEMKLSAEDFVTVRHGAVVRFPPGPANDQTHVVSDSTD